MSFKFDPALLERRAAIKVEVDTRYRAPENLLAAAARKKSHISALEDKPKIPRPRPENGERKPRSSSNNNSVGNDKSITNNGINRKPVTPSTPIIDKSNPIWNIPLKKKEIPIDDDDEEEEKDKKKRVIKDLKPTITSATTINKPVVSNKPSTTTTTASIPKSTTTTASTSSSASSNLSTSNKNKTGSSSSSSSTSNASAPNKSSSSSSSSSRPKPTPAPKPVERKPALAIQNTPTKSALTTNIQPGIGIMSMGNSGNTYMRKESYMDKYNSTSSSSSASASKNILGSANSKLLTVPEKKQGPTIVNTSLATATGGLKYSANHSLNNGKTALSASSKSTANNTKRKSSYSDDEDEEDLFADRYVKKSVKSNASSSPHSSSKVIPGRSSSTTTTTTSNGNSARSSSSSSSSYGFSLNSGNGGSSNNKKSMGSSRGSSKYSDEEDSYEYSDEEYENDSFIDDNSEDDEVKNFMSKLRDKRRGRYDDRDFDDRSMITRAEELEMEERKSTRLAREEDRREEERERRIKEEKERKRREFEKSKRR